MSKGKEGKGDKAHPGKPEDKGKGTMPKGKGGKKK
jgi:hypothetical protein